MARSRPDASLRRGALGLARWVFASAAKSADGVDNLFMTLPTVHEERTLNDHNALTNAPHAMSAVGRSLSQVAPWQSPAVMELAQNVGKGRPEASPMLIEGRTGTVLAAIGEERDHAVAGRALSSAMVQPKLIAAPTALGGGRGMQANQVQQQARAGGGGAIAASTGGGRLAAGNNRQRHGASFGAVYEYRDGAGKPHFVAGTSALPEAAFAEDFEAHASVRNLFEAPRAAPPGRASVVWAGVGGGPCGDEEMKAARDAVCKARAERQQIMELRGAKPYSRHSHMLA